MKLSLFICLLLAACSEPEVAFTPVAVDMPVTASCAAPKISPPPDLLGALPKDAPLADGMKACLQQVLLDRGYAVEMQAAAQACR